MFLQSFNDLHNTHTFVQIFITSQQYFILHFYDTTHTFFKYFSFLLKLLLA